MSLEQAMQGQISGLDFSDTGDNDRRPNAAFLRDQELRFRGDAQRTKPSVETADGISGGNQTSV